MRHGQSFFGSGSILFTQLQREQVAHVRVVHAIPLHSEHTQADINTVLLISMGIYPHYQLKSGFLWSPFVNQQERKMIRSIHQVSAARPSTTAKRIHFILRNSVISYPFLELEASHISMPLSMAFWFSDRGRLLQPSLTVMVFVYQHAVRQLRHEQLDQALKR